MLVFGYTFYHFINNNNKIFSLILPLTCKICRKIIRNPEINTRDILWLKHISM